MSDNGKVTKIFKDAELWQPPPRPDAQHRRKIAVVCYGVIFPVTVIILWVLFL